MLTVGLDAEPPAPDRRPRAARLEHFGVEPPAYAVPPDRRQHGRAAAPPPGDRRRARARGDGPRAARAVRPGEERAAAYDDAALPIGARADDLAAVHGRADLRGARARRAGERVLDVGTGSGYQAAVLAELAAEVVSIERIPELAERRARASTPPATAVEVHVGDGTLGVAEHAPFDAIAVAAAAPALPEPLWEQLRPRGRLVAPGRRPRRAAARAWSAQRPRGRRSLHRCRAGSCRSSARTASAR